MAKSDGELDKVFDERGLVRVGRAAKLLHVTNDLLNNLRRTGKLRGETVEWKNGSQFYGLSLEEINRQHSLIWPKGCPWALKGLCELGAPASPTEA